MILDAFNLTHADCVGIGPDRRSMWRKLKDWLESSRHLHLGGG